MERFWKGFNILEEGVMVVGIAVMVLFNFLNVVFRYLLPQTPFSYTEELVVLIFISGKSYESLFLLGRKKRHCLGAEPSVCNV